MKDEGINEAYLALRSNPSNEKYAALFAALETALRCDAKIYLPVDPSQVEEVRRGTALPWTIIESPEGALLGVFTTPAQALKGKSGAGTTVAVPLAKAFEALFTDDSLQGFGVNPFDGTITCYMDRANLDVCRTRATMMAGDAIPRMPRRLASDACFRLFETAEALPTAVYDLNADIVKAGGEAKLLTPVLARWQKAVEDGSYKPESLPALVRDVLKDVIGSSFVAGALVRDPAEPESSVDFVRFDVAFPQYDEARTANLTTYLDLVVANVRRHFGRLPDPQLWALITDNLDAVGFGAMCFGFAWGLAVHCEQSGADVLAALQKEQTAVLAKIKAAKKS